MVKNEIKGSFPISKVLVFEGNSFFRGKNEDLNKVNNLIKGSFPISKVLVFGGNSYVC